MRTNRPGVPVIIITGFDQQAGMREKSLEAGASTSARDGRRWHASGVARAVELSLTPRFATPNQKRKRVRCEISADRLVADREDRQENDVAPNEQEQKPDQDFQHGSFAYHRDGNPPPLSAASTCIPHRAAVAARARRHFQAMAFLTDISLVVG